MISHVPFHRKPLENLGSYTAESEGLPRMKGPSTAPREGDRCHEGVSKDLMMSLNILAGVGFF